MGGFWIANHEGLSGDQQVPSKKSTLIGSYSMLTGPAIKNVVTKIKEADALQLMSAYYHAHKSELPVGIRENREMIIDLLLVGLSVEDAFSTALKSLD